MRTSFCECSPLPVSSLLPKQAAEGRTISNSSVFAQQFKSVSPVLRILLAVFRVTGKALPVWAWGDF